MSNKIRIGIVGLSASPSAWATSAHLPYLKSSLNKQYQIYAICNSSLVSSEAAIKAHNLPSSTKAYGSYDELAADPDIDLYVVSTRVDTHFECVKPALLKGKNVYVEWPLGSNLSQAKELAQLAKENNVKRTMVGLQGRMSPIVQMVKRMLDEGKLGRLHSVDYKGATDMWQKNSVSEKASYMMDRKVGGNLLTIFGGHLLDDIFHAVGELVDGEYDLRTANIRKKMRIQKKDGSISEEEYDKDTPDQLMCQGWLDRPDGQCTFSFHLRSGDRFIDTPGSVWNIYGEKGELKIEFPGSVPQFGNPTSIAFSNAETGKVEKLELDSIDEEWSKLPGTSQDIGKLYEAFAAGEDSGYADWDVALKRHSLMEEYLDKMK